MSAPIMSRLTDVPFSFLTSHDIRNAISNVIQNERATNCITQTQIDQISRGCHGDLRAALNALEKLLLKEKNKLSKKTQKTLAITSES